MFRRPRPQAAPEPDARPAGAGAGAAPAAESPDAARVLAELLARPTAEGILEGALAHGVTLLGGGAQGYAVRRKGQDRVAAVCGAPRALVGLTLSGPWSGGRPRVVTGSAELYEANPPEVQTQLDACGLRDVATSLSVPLTDRGRNLGALVFDRKGPEPITPAQQEAAAKWAAAVAPLLGLIDARDDWRGVARQLTVAVVEAVESREFDSLGHGQAVAETAVRLGRLVGLAERELEELWYAAALHDLGKLHGEAGHAQVGANFLHGVPHLAEAQRAIRHHHERWDGQGDPGGLGGEDIPLYARILSVANAYVRLGDVERLKAQAGKGLDPRLVGLLEKLPPQPAE